MRTLAVVSLLALCSACVTTSANRFADDEKACASTQGAAAIAAAITVATADLQKSEPWPHVVLDVVEAAGPYELCAVTALLDLVDRRAPALVLPSSRTKP